MFFGVEKIKGRFATLSLVPGMRVYKEKVVKKGGKEYRLWDPFKSKLAAAMSKGLKNFPFFEDSKVLYLGASKGTTVSHLSDIITKGEIYAVEISAECAERLLHLAYHRPNIIPIHADARHPEEYKEVGKVDVIYMDLSQPDQADILIENAKMFLKDRGFALVAIKSQSISTVRKPKEVFKEVLDTLSPYFEILEKIRLEPFDKDHLFVVLRKKERASGQE